MDLKVTTFSKIIIDKENYLVDEYTNQANTIFSMIRQWSIEVIKRYTYKGCGDLLKVTYHIYVVLNSRHSDNLKFNETPILMSMIMSILNTDSIDHCSTPKFNFWLLNSTYLEAISNDDILYKYLN